MVNENIFAAVFYSLRAAFHWMLVTPAVSYGGFSLSWFWLFASFMVVSGILSALFPSGGDDD